MLWLFVGPTGVYLLEFFYSGIQFYLLLSQVDKLGVLHANQISMCLDPHLN